MKKFLFVAVLFFSLSLPALAASFSDVDETNEHYYAIEYLKENEIIHGYQDGTFGPDNSVNRAEAIKIIDGAFGVDFSEEYEEFFPDVLGDDWFFPYVMAAKKLEIINGYDDGTFKPAWTVNLAETLKMIVLAAKMELPAEITEDVFADVLKDEWYAPHALYAKEHNIVMPDEKGNLNAATEMTRADFAEIVYRMKIVLSSGGTSYDLSTNWPTYESTTIPFRMKYDNNEWEIIENDNDVTFFRSDKDYGQTLPDRVYPSSGTVKVVLSKDALMASKEEYFQNIKDAFTAESFTPFVWATFDGLEVVFAEARIVDWYIYLNDKYRLVIFTEYGDGPYGYTLQKTIKAMLKTLKYNDQVEIGGEDTDAILSEIFANILVEGKGEEMLNLLSDRIIIETDTIGVGTGPVDYYYSESVDYTFKYERTSDVILDKREGRTSAF